MGYRGPDIHTEIVHPQQKSVAQPGGTAGRGARVAGGKRTLGSECQDRHKSQTYRYQQDSE